MSKRSREESSSSFPSALTRLGPQSVGGASLDLADGETVRLTCTAVRLFLRDTDAGEGSVHVTTTCVNALSAQGEKSGAAGVSGFQWRS